MNRIVQLIGLMVILLFVGCSVDNSTSPSDKVSIAFSSSLTRTSYFDKSMILEVIQVLVTDSKGNPLPNKRVDWVLLLDGDGDLQDESNLTNTTKTISTDIGEAVNFYTWKYKNEATIKVSVYGYNASVVFTIVRKL